MANMAPTILSIPATPLPSSSSSPSLSDLPTQTTSQPGALAEHQHLGMIVPNLLPLKIDYSGPAEISTYFLIRPFPAPSSSSDPTPSTPSNGVEAPPPSRLLSSFRGRQLVGQPLSFPKGYTGVILDIPAPPSSSFSSTHNPTITSLNMQPDTLQNSFDEDAEEQPLSGGNTFRLRTRQQPARYGSAGPQAAPPSASARKGAAAAKASKAGVKRKARKFKLDSDSEEGEEEEMDQPKEEEVVEQGQPGDVVKEEEVQEKEKVEEETSTLMMEGVEEEAAGLPTPLPSTTTSSTDPTVTASALPSALLSSSSTALLPPSSPYSPPPQIISHSPSPSPQQQQQQPQPTSPSSQSHPHASSVPPRTISVKSTFSSLMLWSPDDPVDEGRDEYCRATGRGGWIELAEVLAESESEGEVEA
jgi:hypothetical protein